LIDKLNETSFLRELILTIVGKEKKCLNTDLFSKPRRKKKVESHHRENTNFLVTSLYLFYKFFSELKAEVVT